MSEHTGMGEEELDAISARANAATEGLWVWAERDWYDDEGPSWGIGNEKPDGGVVTAYNTHCCHFPMDPSISEEDAVFIAHAREDVPALVAEVRRLRASGDTQ